MPGLEALQNAPVLQTQPSGLPAAWVEALSLVQREMHVWATALAELGLPPPVVGYELLDEKGRIVAEAEMAWAALKVSVLLPDTGAEAKFKTAGWTCFVAIVGALPAELKDKLMEVKA
jgi:DEAD/DEAH box helicase domain-containing protein